MRRRAMSGCVVLGVLLAIVLAGPGVAEAQVQVSLQGIHMVPTGRDAREFSRAAFGGGLHASVPIRRLGRLVAVSGGIELVSLLSETVEFQDSQTGLRVEQQTNQDYFRIYLGPEFGPHGRGFFRPHAGVHLAFINYGIATDVVVPDDLDRENEIRQSLRSEHKPTFGYDVAAGADLNFGKWFVEGGARFCKSFNVPQQLGDGAVTIHPGYVQILLGVGMSFAY